MNNKIKEFLYLTINKIKGVYKRDVDDIFNVICDYINSAPYEVFKEIKYCNITAFDEGCSIVHELYWLLLNKSRNILVRR